MSPPKTAHPKFDAFVELGGDYETGPLACVVVKFTFKIEGDKCVLDEPSPLAHDFRNPDAKPRLVAGSDFFLHKPFTDFVVQGSAYAPDGKPIDRMTASVKVGEAVKHVRVYGRRFITFHKGVPRVEPPEKFDKVELAYENAYGGLDWRCPIDDEADLGVQFKLQGDHPGMYPRNPFGKGYLVVPDAVEGMEMPNLESPADRLTADRLIVGDPRRWHQQPLPWCFDWVRPTMFPRFCWFAAGVEAWFPAPDDASLPEVSAGWTPAGFKQEVADRNEALGPHPRFYQEASAGLVLATAPFGTEVTLSGMHPAKPVLQFRLPRSGPRLDFELDGRTVPAEARMHHVVCWPAQEKLAVVFAGQAKLERTFVPGIHKHIPVACRVNGSEPIRYPAPPTQRELALQLRAGKGN